MKSEPDVLGCEIDTLHQLMDEHPALLTVKALAFRSGRDQSTIRRYLSGERTIPVALLRAAFELLPDVRLLNLVTGSMPVIACHVAPPPGLFGVTPIGSPASGSAGDSASGATGGSPASADSAAAESVPPEAPPPRPTIPSPPIADLLALATSATRDAVDAMDSTARIIADGRIDRLDANHLKTLSRAVSSAVGNLTHVLARTYDVAKKAGAAK